MKKTQEVIMITGASKGLGEQLTYHFASKQQKLIICSRNIHELNQVKRKAEALGATIIAIEADVSNYQDVDRLVSVAEEQFGHIDTLINNASIFGPGPTELIDYPEIHFNHVLQINILNPFLVTKRVLSGMLNREEGLIINITSAAGKTGFAEWGAYGISKFALEGMVQTWADELEGTGVHTCLIDPGEMNTTMHEIAVPDCDYPLLEPAQLLPLFDQIMEERYKSNGKRYNIEDYLNGDSI
ncbi:SDR family NAD(P)-dependent oxidoreductase [Alkalihalobacillus pseudalcaliphilus]|uniref:SDR family NAD(P)-dependent oxidoreductase n=1 Tax=Alkalihalobacillus pseudalcaliphilus TaxID=79884 RepID=UPI00064D82EE|nr:SDR family oxidoreductase [Alkalihalobacillus pseudalcaliphilus]KMK77760.1 3-oxoacyl-ACP reductase [Alkalihalobacillus pseudalcaliphilus]